MAWAEVRAGTPAPAVIWRVVVASYSSADRLADVWIRHTISTLAVPSSRAWYAISSGRLGEKGVLSALPSRPTCTWSVGGSRRLNSISTVVLVEGIRTPKWRIIARPPGNREGKRTTCGRRSWHRYVRVTTRKLPLDPSTCRAGSKKFFRKLLK